MREHFGQEVTTAEDGEEFDRFEQEIWTQECSPTNRDNYEIRCQIQDHDEGSLEQLCSQAEGAAADLGLSENQNSSSGIDDRNTIYFGTVSAEPPTVENIKQEHGEGSAG